MAASISDKCTKCIVCKNVDKPDRCYEGYILNLDNPIRTDMFGCGIGYLVADTDGNIDFVAYDKIKITNMFQHITSLKE